MASTMSRLRFGGCLVTAIFTIASSAFAQPNPSHWNHVTNPNGHDYPPE